MTEGKTPPAQLQPVTTTMCASGEWLAVHFAVNLCVEYIGT